MKAITYTVKVDVNGARFWHVKGQLHREDGPAIEYHDGSKEWFLNGLRHRVDGPAMESNGVKEWFVNGLRHREDGPAYENAGGTMFWYIEGEKYSEQDFNKKMNKISCDGKVVEVDGKKYKLTAI